MNEVMCKGDWLIGTACGKCPRCVKLAPTAVAALRSDLKMYQEAWLRSIGGRTFPKGYMIDALIMTTEIMRDELRAYKAAEKKVIDDQQEAEYHRGEPTAVVYPIRIANARWS